MTLTQTVEITDNRRIYFDLPREVPTGKIQVTLQFPVVKQPVDQESVDQRSASQPAPAFEPHPCPLCRERQDSVTGEMRYGPKTTAAIEEGKAMLRGEIPTKWYDNFDDMLADLNSDDEDDNDN